MMLMVMMMMMMMAMFLISEEINVVNQKVKVNDFSTHSACGLPWGLWYF